MIDVGLRNFTAEVLQHDGPVLVDFYSPTCGPCRAQLPILQQLELEGHKVVKLDVTEEPELAVHYQVSAVPTLLVFQKGNVVSNFRGLQPKQRLAEALESAAVLSA